MTTTITAEADWIAEGISRFGDDREKWRFKCPMCSHVLSIAEARVKFAGLKGCNWAPHQECIGRYTKEAGCDWCAYGLFRGPDFVRRADDALTPVFAFGDPL